MPEKKSFVLFNDLSVPVKALSNEDAGQLFKAIFEYQNGGIERELTPSVEIAFIFVKQQLDRNQEKYKAICERNRINGAKGGRPKEPKEPTGLSGNPKEPKKPDNDNDNDNDNEPEKKIKEIKHKYGEYNHVLLTDKQYEDLKDKVDDREKWIRIIDESIEEKGNKYNIKNFNLAIQKWYGRDNTVDKAEAERNKKFDERQKARLEREKARGIV